jgi:hypothetical protein
MKESNLEALLRNIEGTEFEDYVLLNKNQPVITRAGLIRRSLDELLSDTQSFAPSKILGSLLADGIAVTASWALALPSGTSSAGDFTVTLADGYHLEVDGVDPYWCDSWLDLATEVASLIAENSGLTFRADLAELPADELRVRVAQGRLVGASYMCKGSQELLASAEVTLALAGACWAAEHSRFHGKEIFEGDEVEVEGVGAVLVTEVRPPIQVRTHIETTYSGITDDRQLSFRLRDVVSHRSRSEISSK